MKKLNEGFVVPLVIAVIAVLAIGVYFYFYEQYQTSPDPTANSQANVKEDNESNFVPHAEDVRSSGDVTGPSSLHVKQMGTWEIGLNRGSTYAVVWSDGTPVKFTNGESGIPADIEFHPSAVFTHSFSNAGNYHVQFFSKEPGGKVNVKSLDVSIK